MRIFAPVTGVSVAAMTAVAALRADSMPLWRDEVASYTIADRSLGDTLAVVADFEANGAFYYLFMNGWLRLGSDELWVRAPTIAFAAAAVVAAAMLARRLAGDLAGCIVAPLLALNVGVIELAAEARAYTLMLLLATVSSHLYLTAVERGGRRAWLAYAAAAAAMTYAGVLGILVVLAHALSIVALQRSRWPGRDALPALALLAVAVAPLIAFVALRNEGQTSWIGPVRLSDFTGVWTAWLGGKALTLLCAAVIALAAAGTVRLARTEGRGDALWRSSFVGAWLVVPPILLFSVSLAVQPLWQPRYVIWSLPALCIAVALGIAQLRRPTHVAAAGALLIGCFAVALAMKIPDIEKSEDLRAAAGFVSTNSGPGDAIAYAPAFARLGFAHYLQRQPRDRSIPTDISADPGFDGPRHGEEFVAEDDVEAVHGRLCRQRRLWVVGYPGADWHPTPEPFLLAASRGGARGLVETGSWAWGQITVKRFERRAGMSCALG